MTVPPPGSDIPPSSGDSTNEPNEAAFEAEMSQAAEAPSAEEIEHAVSEAVKIANTDINTATPTELNMLKYFGLPLEKETLYQIRSILKEMQMGAYRYLKGVFEKSRKRRQEEFREYWYK